MSAPLVRRELRARPGRLTLVLATVVVSVGFCVGAFGFSQRVEALIAPPTVGIDEQLPEGTVVLTANTNSITTPTALDSSLLAKLRKVDGVAQAGANYDQPLEFVVPAGTQTNRPPVLRGVVLSSTSDTRVWKLVAGRFPNGPGEVAVDAGGGVVGEVRLGERAPLQFPTTTIDVEVVGVVQPAASSASLAGMNDPAAVALASAHVILDPQWAPMLLDAVGRSDRLTAIPVPGVDPDVLAARIRRAMPPGISVLAATSRAAQTQHTIASIDDDVRTATIAYAGLTMLVAVLVIANSYSVLVAQRTRELGLLRLIGASRSQVARAVVGESVVVGLTGAALGGGLGVLLAYLASRIVRTTGVQVGFSVTPAMAVVAVVVGVTTSVIGSSWPAWRASRVPPIEALSDTRGGADRPSRGFIPLAFTVAGLGAAAWLASRPGAFDAGRLALIGGAILVGFVGLALLSRWIVVPFTRLVRRPLELLVGVSARLGVGNTARQPSRTAGAASTLMVGLALVSTVGTFGASSRQAIAAQVGAAGRADLYFERRGVVRVSTTSIDQIIHYAERGIADSVEITEVDGLVLGRHGATTAAVASDPVAAGRIIDLGRVQGTAGDGTAMLSADTAKLLGVRVGGTVTLRSVSGETRKLTVSATYTNTAILGPAVVPWHVARQISADGTFDLAAMRLNPRAPPDLVQRFLKRELRHLPKVSVETPEAFAAFSTSVADTTLRIIFVLLIGALGIGVLGLASTLALSTLERRRELVLLRAVGASRAQVRGLVWLEATMIGVIAAVVGIGTGTAIGRVGVAFAPGTLGGFPVIPWLDLAGVAVGSVVTAWAVSIGVARRASRVPPAEAGRI